MLIYVSSQFPGAVVRCRNHVWMHFHHWHASKVFSRIDLHGSARHPKLRYCLSWLTSNCGSQQTDICLMRCDYAEASDRKRFANPQFWFLCVAHAALVECAKTVKEHVLSLWLSLQIFALGSNYCEVLFRTRFMLMIYSAVDSWNVYSWLAYQW